MKRATLLAIGLVIIILFLVVKPVRTVNTMEGIASEELENVLFNQFSKAHYEAVLKQLEGPKIIENEEENYVEFIWYTKLASSDTAYIY